MTASIPGVDYSSGRPGGAALAAAGQRFAARYLSHTPSKNLLPAEAADLAAHGVSVIVVWETTANRAAAGRAAGAADAVEAAAQAAACGQPPTRPVFFAVDFDADPADVAPYFQGVASVLGGARTGVYGGYRVVAYLLDHQLATWAWQTVAWSRGQWDPRAVIRQGAREIRIAGVQCDIDTATTADYGQWTPGKNPTIQEDDDMPLTDADTTKVWAFKNTKAGDTHDAHQALRNAEDDAHQALAQARANGSALSALAAKVDGLKATAPTIDYAKLAAALLTAIKNGS